MITLAELAEFEKGRYMRNAQGRRTTGRARAGGGLPPVPGSGNRAAAQAAGRRAAQTGAKWGRRAGVGTLVAAPVIAGGVYANSRRKASE